MANRQEYLQEYFQNRIKKDNKKTALHAVLTELEEREFLSKLSETISNDIIFCKNFMKNNKEGYYAGTPSD